ncbi:MAG: IS66 family insertion sequence element accessory protein TnpB [Burkholderiaceae bacterium]
MAAKPQGRSYWEPHVRAAMRAGAGMVGYARDHGVSEHALSYWFRKLKAEQSGGDVSGAASASPRFVALEVSPDQMGASDDQVTVIIAQTKRLEQERFAWPTGQQGPTTSVTLQQFECLLEGFDLWPMRAHKNLYFEAVS